VTRLERDLADLRTFAAARMSAATIAGLLGRSPAWVNARLAEAAAPDIASGGGVRHG
jgi:hypothetical protein